MSREGRSAAYKAKRKAAAIAHIADLKSQGWTPEQLRAEIDSMPNGVRRDLLILAGRDPRKTKTGTEGKRPC